MRKSTFLGGVCAALGLSLAAAAPSTASAACSAATTGTIVGGVGGALIGNANEPGRCIYRDRYGRRYEAPCR